MKKEDTRRVYTENPSHNPILSAVLSGTPLILHRALRNPHAPLLDDYQVERKTHSEAQDEETIHPLQTRDLVNKFRVANRLIESPTLDMQDKIIMKANPNEKRRRKDESDSIRSSSSSNANVRHEKRSKSLFEVDDINTVRHENNKQRKNSTLNCSDEPILIGKNVALNSLSKIVAQPKSSSFCHLCTRRKISSRRLVNCHNIDVYPRCKKSACEECFKIHPWLGNFEEIFAAKNHSWICPHCQSKCPGTAQCDTYNKVNKLRASKSSDTPNE